MSSSNFVPRSLAVIGAGPSGCVLAAFLARGGYEVTFCDVVDTLINKSLSSGIVIGGSIEIKSKVSNICNNIEDLIFYKPDVIFVATKATALPVVARSLKKIHKAGVYIVSWQNGIDTELELSKVLSSKWIIRAVVNYGCSLIEPSHVHVSFHYPPHYLQEMNLESSGEAKIIGEMMTGCTLNTEHTDDIRSMVWRKAILNASMNPVCAVTGVTMYEAMRETYIFNIVNSILKECILVAEETGVVLGEGYYEHAINYMSNAGDHKPSMLMDMENSRKTEIDYINGKFEEYGLRLNIKTPYNTLIRSLIKGKEFKFLKL